MIDQKMGPQLNLQWKEFIVRHNAAAFGWQAQMTRDSFADESMVFILAEEEGQPVGYLMGRLLPPEGEIIQLLVESSYQRRGIGQQLIASLQSLSSINSLFLEVRDSNQAALALYHKQDFKPIGIRKNYYQDPREDAQILQWTRSEKA